IEVGELTVKPTAGAEPNLTCVVPLKSSPLMPTFVAPKVEPFVGFRALTVGGGPRANANCKPPAMPFASTTPLDSTGTVLQGWANGPQDSGPVLVPSPSAPCSLSPQAMTLPLVSRAR